MAVRLYVGNLPYNATEAELREHFSAIGPVSGVWIATDRETGRPRGFAFVEFEERALAEEAVRRFNSKPFGGRPLAVNEARPQERAGPGGPAGAGAPMRRPGPPPTGAPRYGSGPPRSDGPSSDGGPPRPRPPFRPAPGADAGFFPEGGEPARRTRDAAPRKKKEREKSREFDKVRPPKQRPIQVASGGRFFSSDDFDEDELEVGELDLDAESADELEDGAEGSGEVDGDINVEGEAAGEEGEEEGGEEGGDEGEVDARDEGTDDGMDADADADSARGKLGR